MFLQRCRSVREAVHVYAWLTQVRVSISSAEGGSAHITFVPQPTYAAVRLFVQPDASVTTTCRGKAKDFAPGTSVTRHRRRVGKGQRKSSEMDICSWKAHGIVDRNRLTAVDVYFVEQRLLVLRVRAGTYACSAVSYGGMKGTWTDRAVLTDEA